MTGMGEVSVVLRAGLTSNCEKETITITRDSYTKFAAAVGYGKLQPYVCTWCGEIAFAGPAGGKLQARTTIRIFRPSRVAS